MAHELEVIDGVASHFYVGKTPWHGLGQALDSPPTVADGIKLAGLDWQVGLEPLFLADGREVPRQGVIRQTDRSILGTVGPDYEPLQNSQAFQWFQPILDSGLATLHTAGSLQAGRKVWVLAKVAGPSLQIADNDTVERFILLSNSHDGTRSVRVGFTPVRVVCWNTLAMAVHHGESQLLRLSHTKNVVQSLEALREVMNVANSQFEATAEQYRKLAQFRISGSDLRKYVKQVLSVPEEETDHSTKLSNKIESIIRFAESGRGNDNPAVKGTLWSAYNGITEYLGTEYGRSQDNRMDSLWFGQNAGLSARALELAIAMAV